MNLSGLLAKFALFVASAVPTAILFATMVCLFALIYARGEFFYRRYVRGDIAPRGRQSKLGLLLTLIGIAAMLICGQTWLAVSGDPAQAFEIAGRQFTSAGLYFMASAVVFDIGAVLLLCSQARDEAQSQTAA